MAHPLPRYVIPKVLRSGKTAYYFNVPNKFKREGCPVLSEALGTDYRAACCSNGLPEGEGGKASILNAQIDAWQASRAGEPLKPLEPVGTVDWLFRTYKSCGAYLEKVSPRSRPGYERTMLWVADTLTKSGARVGSYAVKGITPAGADLLYKKFIIGTKGERPREGEKAVKLCSKAWRTVRRLHPEYFANDVPDPWAGVALKRRIKKTKPAATRDQVYAFARGCVELGRPEAAAAAVICFEWLQRPENVLAGYIRWTDYRGRDNPGSIRIHHHKTGKMVFHPLEEMTDDGAIKFYEDAEEILAHLPRRGIPMIMREVLPSRREPNRPTIAKLYSFSGFEKLVQTMRTKLELPSTFTLDACRHGGMTELEEAELTDGQGRALSAHTSKAYDGYAKRTMKRALRLRGSDMHMFWANRPKTSVQNDGRNGFQNDAEAPNENAASDMKINEN
jgi:hypothetical protein